MRFTHPQLFVVLQEPKAANSNLRAAVYHTQARSNSEAVRNYRERVGLGHDPRYKAPKATHVVTGSLLYV